MIPDLFRDNIISIIRYELPDVEAIYLFGSQVKGGAAADSDIDLAVLCPNALSPVMRWDLAQTLAVALDQDVDLIDLKEANTVMQWQIIQTGERIFAKDSCQLAFFETYVFSDYIRLMELRQGIVDDIKQRGTVYG